MRKALTACLVLAPFCLHPAGAANKAPASEPVTVLSARVGLDRDNPSKKRFGRLEWLGTLRLSSDSRDFGGLSGLAISASGDRILAVTDKGRWLRADIVYADGRPERIANARMGEIRGLGGRPLKGKSEQDAEGLALDSAGTLTGKAYISFERKHRITVHHVTEKGIGPAIRHLRLPPRVRSAKRNGGVEAIARLRGGPSRGALLAFTENYLDRHGNHVGWLIGGRRPGMLTLKRRGGFSVTDMASLGNGDAIVLERRFRYSEGVKMRIRRIAAAAIRPGATLDGEVLFKADQLFEIDNMEGLAAHTDARGRTILTIVSDDNFNRVFQRTLLMQFAVVE